MSTAIVLINLGTPIVRRLPPSTIPRRVPFRSAGRESTASRLETNPAWHHSKTRPKRLQHDYKNIWGTHDGPIRNIGMH